MTLGAALTRLLTATEDNTAKDGRRPRCIALQAKLRSCRPQQNKRKPEQYFERALAVARKQQAKSWELRAAMSMARLWRDQGKPQQARESACPGLRLVH